MRNDSENLIQPDEVAAKAFDQPARPESAAQKRKIKDGKVPLD